MRAFAIGHQQADQIILGAVGVLVLIHQDVAKAFVPIGQHLFVLPEELNRHQNQIIKIEGIVVGECLLIIRVYFCNYPPTKVRLLALYILRRKPLVLSVADGIANGAGFKLLIIQIFAQNNRFHQALGIRLIKNRKVAGANTCWIVVFLDVEPQDTGTKGVKGANPQVLGDGFVDLRSQPHLLRFGQGIQGFSLLRQSLLFGE